MVCLRSTLFLLVTCLAWGGTEARAEEVSSAQKVKRLVARGDRIFDHKGGKKATWQAMGFYKAALELAPRSFAARWKMARGFARLARIEREAGGCDRTLGRKGHYHAVQAMAIEPKRVEGYYWGAATIGEHGKCLPMIRALTAGIRGKFVSYARSALRLDPSFDDGGPPRMLAMYNNYLPIPLRDRARSFKQIRRSWKLSPGHPRTLFCWAQILWDDGQKELAIKKLRRCLSANSGGSPALNRAFQKNCRKLLREYEG